MPKITPFLWFDTQAEESAKYYTSVFPNSQITEISHYDKASSEAAGLPEGTVLVVSFELDGQEFRALNGGPIFKFNESVSFQVDCEDQKEIDYYWEKLSADPDGGQCGWCKDKYGLSWQIVPKNMSELTSSENGMQTMMQMKKIDIATLKEANK